MMAAYIGAVALVMGYLITSSIVGQKIEYRETFARFEPLGNGALREATRYWTQSDMNSRLVDLSGIAAVQSHFRDRLGLLFLGFTVWRFSMTERAPSKRRLRKLAKREARDTRVAAVAPVARWRPSDRARLPAVALGPVHDPPADRGPPGPDQPRADRAALFAIGNTAAGLVARPVDLWDVDHPTLAATVDRVRGGFSIFLLMIAVFYGGELVWRERDRQLNEILDSTPVASWVDDRPEDPRDLRRAARRQSRRRC